MARETTSAKRVAAEARLLLPTLTAVLRRASPALADQVLARIADNATKPWQRLPALSMALAACARLSAHDIGSCGVHERANRLLWAELSSFAPSLTVVDLVLAELLIIAPEASRSCPPA